MRAVPEIPSKKDLMLSDYRVYVVKGGVLMRCYNDGD